MFKIKRVLSLILVICFNLDIFLQVVDLKHRLTLQMSLSSFKVKKGPSNLFFMKTYLEHIFLSVWQYTPLYIWP